MFSIYSCFTAFNSQEEKIYTMMLKELYGETYKKPAHQICIFIQDDVRRQLAGILSYTKNPNSITHALYVEPEYRWMGIGTVLLRTCLMDDPPNSYAYINESNEASCRLHRKMGHVPSESYGNLLLFEKIWEG